MVRTLKLLVLTLVTSFSSLGFAHAEAVAWRTDLAAAQAEAAKSGKLVLIHFYTDSCGPCRLLDKNVFTMPAVSSALEANYVPVKMNANQMPQVSQAYGVSRVPTDVVTDAQGKLVKKLVSPANPMAYMGTMTNVVGEYRSTHGAYAQYAQNAPTPSALPASAGNQAATSGLNPAYAGLGIGTGGLGSMPASASPAMQQPAISQPTPSIVGNRYAMASNESAPASSAAPAAATYGQPAAAQAPTANSGSALVNPYYGTQATPATKNQAKNSAASTINKPVSERPVANQVAKAESPQPSIKPVVEPVVNKNAGQPKQVAVTSDVKLPAGSPPLGFDGYCPVTMKDNWQWVKGDTKWGAIHRGRTYLFTSEASRDKFLASPDTFSPALSGSDPVLAVDTRQSVPGTREYALEYEGKFYFFSSEQTLNKFWTNAEGYSKGTERVAAAIEGNGKIIR